MKRKLNALTQRYAVALQKHLKLGPQASLRPALGLGRQALALGLETLDVARIHEAALATLDVCDAVDETAKWAEAFFAESIGPIEETHQAALKTNHRLGQLHKTLDRRTVDLAASNQFLKHGVSQRKTLEEALKKSSAHSEELLRESRRLEKHLQKLTHQILSAQENKHKQISRELQNEIAQTLLGINVRLLALKKEAVQNAQGLQKEIANTQRLVDKSVKSIKRFAREFGNRHES